MRTYTRARHTSQFYSWEGKWFGQIQLDFLFLNLYPDLKKKKKRHTSPTYSGSGCCTICRLESKGLWQDLNAKLKSQAALHYACPGKPGESPPLLPCFSKECFLFITHNGSHRIKKCLFQVSAPVYKPVPSRHPPRFSDSQPLGGEKTHTVFTNTSNQQRQESQGRKGDRGLPLLPGPRFRAVSILFRLEHRTSEGWAHCTSRAPPVPPQKNQLKETPSWVRFKYEKEGRKDQEEKKIKGGNLG